MAYQLDAIELTKKYGRREVLSGFSFHFEAGIYGLLGPNGAGKSTLIRLLTGYEKATSGRIEYEGTDIEMLGADYRKEIGYMPQYQCLYDNYSFEAYLDYICAIKRIPHTERKEIIKKVAAKVGLADHLGEKLRTFSGGMRQRVMLAQALLGNPHILILDEPSAGLDPKERNRLRNLIAEISENKIILIATHIVSDIELIANRVIILSAGKIKVSGTIDEICSALAGHVFEKKVPDMKATVSDQIFVTGVFRELDGTFRVRFIAESGSTGENWIPVSPNLDDIYIYYFRDEVI